MAKIGYLGHSCFSIEMGGKRLLLDPFITPNPKASSIQVSELEADIILVSHGHQDHVADLMTLAKQTGAAVLSCFEITNWVDKQGHANTIGMNFGGTHRAGSMKIKMVNALHSSSFDDGSYAGNPAGFVLSDEDFCVYYAGDTGLHLDMKLVGASFDVDLAILPIGDTFTMGYEDAVMAAEFVGATKCIGMHYDTFPPIEIDKGAAKKYFKKNARELILLDIGEERTFNR